MLRFLPGSRNTEVKTRGANGGGKQERDKLRKKGPYLGKMAPFCHLISHSYIWTVSCVSFPPEEQSDFAASQARIKSYGGQAFLYRSLLGYQSARFYAVSSRANYSLFLLVLLWLPVCHVFLWVLITSISPVYVASSLTLLVIPIQTTFQLSCWCCEIQSAVCRRVLRRQVCIVLLVILWGSFRSVLLMTLRWSERLCFIHGSLRSISAVAVIRTECNLSPYRDRISLRSRSWE